MRKIKQVLLRIFGDSNHGFASTQRQRRSSLTSHQNLGHLTEGTPQESTFSGPAVFGRRENIIQQTFPHPTCTLLDRSPRGSRTTNCRFCALPLPPEWHQVSGPHAMMARTGTDPAPAPARARAV